MTTTKLMELSVAFPMRLGIDPWYARASVVASIRQINRQPAQLPTFLYDIYSDCRLRIEHPPHAGADIEVGKLAPSVVMFLSLLSRFKPLRTGRCEVCRFEWKPTAAHAIEVTEGCFQGLCVDCMKRSWLPRGRTRIRNIGARTGDS